MKKITDIAAEIVSREGGFVDDPADPGGATNHGVTLSTLRRLGLDLNRDGQVDRGDLRQISPAQAVRIFVQYYFERPGLGQLPEALQPSVFDMYVNAGANAVKILQNLLNHMGADLEVDGALGPQTVAAAMLAADGKAGLLADAYGIERRNYYYRLGDARPASRKFVRRKDGGKGGWILRAEEFISPRFHLTDAQHRERVAAWG
ncbi:MAG: holin-associated N-acetylmuramidase [Rhodobacteraceae bacterium]|nr:holin-associated N-acetylmuramidase [Paracoccaceae bacterium]